MLSALIVIALLAVAPGAVLAAPVTFGFTAEVTNVQLGGTGSVDVSVGDTISGFYRFESTVPDTDSSLTVGSYDGAILEAGAQLGADLAAYSSGAPANNITAANDFLPIAGDLYTVTLADTALDGASFATFNGSLVDDASFAITLDDLGVGTLLSSQDLPVLPPDPSLAAPGRNFIAIDGFTSPNDGFRVIGTILTLSLVPEPSLGGLVLLGLAVGAAASRRAGS